LTQPIPSRDDDGARSSLLGASDGREYWLSVYLIPHSDAWKELVYGFEPNDPLVAAGYIDWEFYCRRVIGLYGKLSVADAPAMLGSLAELCAHSPSIAPGDFVSLFAEPNIQQAARQLRTGHRSDRSIVAFASRCRAFAHSFEAAPPPTDPTEEPGSDVPYMRPTQESFWSLFTAQHDARTRFETRAAMCATIGAGGDAADLRFWRFTDVNIHSDGTVDIVWHGLDSRTVPVAEPWASRLRELLADPPDAGRQNWVIHGPRTARLLPDLNKRVNWQDHATFNAGRGRSTWIIDRLSSGCPPDAIRLRMGADTFTQIGEAARYLPQPHGNDLEASFRSGTRQ